MSGVGALATGGGGGGGAEDVSLPPQPDSRPNPNKADKQCQARTRQLILIAALVGTITAEGIDSEEGAVIMAIVTVLVEFLQAFLSLTFLMLPEAGTARSCEELELL